ncbi:hypothetical protein FRC07_010683 [Ceratobasidium sp. 392]|nr:hypothetical protein FRC07_010683 [Ceratobasidium sp. 392]
MSTPKNKSRATKVSTASQGGVKRMGALMDSDSDHTPLGIPKRPWISQPHEGDMDPKAPKLYLELEKVRITVKDEKFLVHAYKIKEFAKISKMLEDARVEEDLRVIELPEIAASVAPLIEVPYTPYVPAIPASLDIINIDYPQHPNLREYAIQTLGARQQEIPPMRRIRLSRAYNLPSWLPKAVEELSEREQTITLEEANELGAEVFANVSREHESAKYSKGLKAGRAGKKH